jgi:hypothetical protein
MDPTREPPSTSAEPAAAHDLLTDDAVVAYLRDRAPGLPAAPFDARAVTSRARGALHRRRRRVRSSVVVAAGATAAYLALTVAGPLPVPGVGTVSVPGGDALRALVADIVSGEPAQPDQWPGDVDRLEAELLPVFEELEVSYYLLEPGPCRILEYPRGRYSDQQDCGEMAPFDAQATADFDAVTDAVERSDVAVERITRYRGGIFVRLHDGSWEYNWDYAYLPDGGEPFATTGMPGEEWTHIRGDWWYHRTFDD